MDNLLKINNLSISFDNQGGEIEAVKGVSLHLKKGETLALVGESGSGKTVICKSMLKLLCSKGRQGEGKIIFDGKDISSLEEDDIRAYRGGKIAMIFQDPATALDPAFSVGEQIAEAVRLHKGLSKREAEKEALELMEKVKIHEPSLRYNQRPYQFSGGMRQRAVIAMALAGEPEVLLADEPTTALDGKTRDEIINLLKEIQRETGVAMIFVTHDLSIVEDIADRVAIMKEGVLLEEGSVKNVFEFPTHEYTKKLLGYLNYSRNRGHNHKSEAKNEGEREIVISLKNINVDFNIDKKNKVRVLRDFNMTVFRGEVLGIVGESGVGKSTLAGVITGLQKFEDGGQVWIKEDINLQMIFQDTGTAFNERMTVEKIVAEPLVIKKEKNRDERVLKAVCDAGLDEFLMKRKPYELSGGQRQRVAIARALVTDPDVIIADEPLTGLDVSTQAQIVHLFKKLAVEKNLTIIFIAHDLPMVNHISDRVIELSSEDN